MRRLLERLEAETASQTEDIAALAAMLARIDARLAAGEEPPPQETASGAEIAEAEGRITAHVDRLAGHIETTARTMPEIWKMAKTAAAAPGEIGKLRETVQGLARGQSELSGKTSDHTLGLMGFQGKLAHKLDEATNAMAGRFSEEARSIRESVERTAAIVLERRRFSRRLRWIVAGAILFLMLACTAAGIWLQWEFVLAPPKTETGGT